MPQQCLAKSRVLVMYRKRASAKVRRDLDYFRVLKFARLRTSMPGSCDHTIGISRSVDRHSRRNLQLDRSDARSDIIAASSECAIYRTPASNMSDVRECQRTGSFAVDVSEAVFHRETRCH
jgi:hypothetical protein